MSDARILVVDDEQNIRELIDEILSEEGYAVTTAENAATARKARRSGHFDLTLLDIWMPDTDGISLLKEWADSGSLGSVVMMSGHGTVDTAVEATRLGALDFIEKPVSLNQLLRTVSRALSGRTSARTQLSASASSQLIGKSQGMQDLRERLGVVARHQTNLLVTGEPGAGRTQAARHLLSLTSQPSDAFELIAGNDLNTAEGESILRGSSTSPGALRRARGGILFIRDVDRVNSHAQTVLRSVLVSSSTTSIGARIIASAAPGFERDREFGVELMNQVGAVVIRVPALRERAEDVPELLRFFTDLFVEQERLPFRRFGIPVQNRLRNYPWPGNVSELQQVVRQLLVQGGPEEVALEEVELELRGHAAESGPLIKQDLLSMPLREAREHFERAYLQQQLQLCGGKVGQLAKRVGMERTHLYRKLRALGINFRQVSGED